MFRNLAGNLITHERIVTTDAKAKELRRVTDRLITKAKRLGAVAHTPQSELNDEQKAKRLHVARQLETFLPRFGIDSDGERHNVVDKVLVELSKRFAERPGGYTRIIKLGPRRGDNADMSIIEFVDASPVAPTYEEASIGGGEAEAAEETAEAAEEADETDAEASDESEADEEGDTEEASEEEDAEEE
jgi:large subunit ribosomal protein L17